MEYTAKQKLELTVHRINVILLSLVLLASLWNFSIFFIPVLLMTGITIFEMIRNNHNTISVPVIILFSLLLLLNEIINYFISDYKENSILFLRDLFLIINLILLFYQILRDKKIQIYFVIFISIMAGLLALLNIPIFFFRYYESVIYGFDDFTHFRFLYRPIGFLSNEWVTILLCFLPFPVIGLFLFWKKILIRNGFLFIISLLVFNIFTSFSRAGILAFLLFVFFLNFFIGFNRFYPVKKIILFNAVLLLLFILFAFCFSESILSSIQQTHSHQRSTAGRLKQWEQTLDVVDNAPYFGVGSKNYALLGRSTQQVDLENPFTGRVNNTYIQLVIEKGWVGFSFWMCTIGILVFYLFQRNKKRKNRLDKTIDCILISAILAVLFREIFFSSLFYNSGVLLFFFILLIFNHKKTEKILKIRKSVVVGGIALFTFCAICFYFKQPNSVLTYAENGLRYERSTEIQISFNSLDNYSENLIKSKQDTIKQAIVLYKEAYRLSPSDAMFQHNLGWLYWINQQPDSALIYLSHAIKSEPNIALYHISKGLIIESQNLEEAFESYMQAVLLSPDIIDSSFFIDLKKRSPAKTRKLLEKASSKLLQILSNQYSSIIEAKSGKLLLSLGKTDQAYEVFNHITQIHPNLNRPWYYLGLIEKEKGNYDNMQVFYKKSLFLSPSDHLPLYAFAYYYEDIEDNLKSESYFKVAEKAWKNKRSVHSSRCKRMYYSETEKDDVIPKGLLDYITPIYQTQIYDSN